MLFWFEWRINRAPFWGYSILVSVIYIIISWLLTVAAISSGNETLGIIGQLFIIPMIWISFALYVKRLHDLDKKGWISLLLFVPFANIYVFIVCGFFKWTNGSNKFGSDPLNSSNSVSDKKEENKKVEL